MSENSQDIKSFINELSEFAHTAEETLTKIEKDKEANRGLFSVFSEKMFAIRGTAQQLNLAEIAEIAELGEEIAVKGTGAETRPQVRKCIGSLWDALTTVKYLLVHHHSKGFSGKPEEYDILIHRLKKTLEAFGGARERIEADEIQKLLQKKS